MRRRSPDPSLVAPADLAACREMIRGGSRSFFAASLLLPDRVREPALSLYAFCRAADDAIDLAPDPVPALAAVRERLDRAYAGDPLPEPADRAFADVVRRFDIPRALPESLVDGFAWDAAGRRCDDLPALYAYGTRVAGSVGVMMSLLMGVRDEAALARASDLGIAMQLSNVARDVGEDARNGRLYLPLDWLREAGIDVDAFMREPRFTPALGGVVQRLLRAADVLYGRAVSGIAMLPEDCRAAIRAACLLYAAIGHEVERNGLDSVSQRAVVPASRKFLLLARALAAGDRREGAMAPPLAEARHLVAAVAELPVSEDDLAASEPAWWNLTGRMARIVDLFAELEQRERARAAAGRQTSVTVD